MFIKHFREVTYRVPDPMHPGRNVFDRRLDSSKTHSLSHLGKLYEADSDGWFDVPDEVGKHFISFPGWCSPEMVDEEVVAGRIRADATDSKPSTRELVEASHGISKPKSEKKPKPEKKGKAPSKRGSKAASESKSEAEAEEGAAAGVS